VLDEHFSSPDGRNAMKILLFANTSWYLFNYCLPLAEEIRKRGCDIVLVSPKDDYTTRLESAGFRHLSFPIHRRGLNPITEWITLQRLVRLFLAEKPAIVHNFTTKCLIYGSLAGRRTGVPLVVNSVTGMGYAFSGDQVWRWVLRLVIKFLYRRSLPGTRVVFQNPRDREDFIRERLVEPEQTVLIRSSGVNLEKFVFTPESEETPLVVLAGRMLQDKGVEDFVEAARMLKQRQVAARFVLVGASDDQNPTSIPAQKLKAWHNAGAVEWWGWREDMAQVFQQAHIVCLPSAYREGVPKTLIEAAATGRAIVTTDTAGCREVVEHGRNGLLVPVHSVKALAEAIQTLVENRELRQQMGRVGRQVVESDFKLQNVLAAIMKIYRIETNTG
jgi:glycosyltransferase involved in cell wall biosynthesis